MGEHMGETTAAAPDAQQESVLLHRDGRAGRIVLNRPRAINALDLAMVRRIDAALDAWERDASVAVVVVSGAGERGLCAGGDVRAIRADVLAGGGEASRSFWREEYRLNARIARFGRRAGSASHGKHYVALMDGIVMGGGVGISAHGSVRVVTERSAVAMPETTIGFVPDVGGTYLLSRAPGELGTHLALTAAPVGAADALLCGLADAFVPAARLPQFAAALADQDVEQALRQYSGEAPPGRLAGQRAWIDACYSADTVEEILARLLDSDEPDAKEAAGLIAAKSPTSLKVTLAALRRARRLDTLEQVLEQEFRVSCATLTGPDLVEGVRAQVVDKDRSPHWTPPTLAEVDRAAVERHFAPAGLRPLFG
ncbi:enoyl-CoA hydratase/isomerase family protein [Streptacidiphilus sp. PB12-B1b]|uniref:enoyl-CoA hydratase/isomerase family protein n=1 Tax=Streptacidiphilus sp. PB12-B1b TaxID=2705012 RepID=UPI001CDC3FC1|nr:enoyl-CoA hydratase/isomerase family protein [Streptacidiphilus sp. PB12-B1b]QMU76594.1 enoyl-CoA hydratase/isomerase family protein [Streptacidiphilus sp. PB12-B1b]